MSLKPEEALGAAIDYTNKSLAGAGGLKGEDGKSAYQIAVEKGFEGTEEEWLESLKATVVVDDELSETSENAVKNKVIKKEFDLVKVDLDAAYDAAFSGHYGVCETAEEVAAKTVNIPQWVGYDGESIYVRFAYAISKGTNMTLSVNGSDDYTVLYNGIDGVSSICTDIENNSIFRFVFVEESECFIAENMYVPEARCALFDTNGNFIAETYVPYIKDFGSVAIELDEVVAKGTTGPKAVWVEDLCDAMHEHTNQEVYSIGKSWQVDYNVKRIDIAFSIATDSSTFSEGVLDLDLIGSHIRQFPTLVTDIKVIAVPALFSDTEQTYLDAYGTGCIICPIESTGDSISKINFNPDNCFSADNWDYIILTGYVEGIFLSANEYLPLATFENI